jgi:arginase
MTNTVRIIGVPMDLGQSRRGVDMGPSAVRYAGLGARLRRLGWRVEDVGNLAVPTPEEDNAGDPRPGGLHHLPAVARVCQAVCDAGRAAVGAGAFPIFLGGDHSIAVGTVAGVSAPGETLGLIWVDAHGDYNTPESSPSGNVHGMPLAHLLGHGVPELIDIGYPGPKVRPENVALIGIRSLDEQERRDMLAGGMQVYTMRDIDELGIGAVARQVLGRLKRASRIHVSFDLDVLDPNLAAGVGTPVPGGLTYREAHLLMELLADSRQIGSLDLVEINPILDQGNHTAELAVELAASLLGQSIL